MTLKLPRLPQSEQPWSKLALWWQRLCEAIEAGVANLQDAIDAIAQAQAAAAVAQTAADNANNAAAAIEEERALVNSYVTG
ncbi:MAG: hypothetical protein SNJ62_04915, partial [Chloracidobacterium sp.]